MYETIKKKKLSIAINTQEINWIKKKLTRGADEILLKAKIN